MYHRIVVGESASLHDIGHGGDEQPATIQFHDVDCVATGKPNAPPVCATTGHGDPQVSGLIRFLCFGGLGFLGPGFVTSPATGGMRLAPAFFVVACVANRIFLASEKSAVELRPHG